MISEVVSHYRIMDKLGCGGMGEVYKAEDVKLKRTVALKFLPPSFSYDEAAKQRLIQEAQSASALDHPNICTIHEINETDDGRLFIAMSYYAGETLKEKIARGPVEINEAISITRQICEGLNKAHKKGIIHRDIKPANIFITNDGIVKILDFGLAKVVDETKLSNWEDTSGTINYMSPEQARGGKIDFRTDIWSLGIIMYEMLTGKKPFSGDYDHVVLYLIMNEEPKSITSLRSEVPIEFERIVKKALSKYPSKRYQHMNELSDDLRIEQKKLKYVKSGYPGTKTNDNRIIQNKTFVPENVLRKIIPVAVAVIVAVIFLIINPFKLWQTQNPISEISGNSLAVMYFENIPDPEDKNHTGEMLTNLLITSLSQIKSLDVISRERLLDIQKEIGETDFKNLSPVLARQVAINAGVSKMLIGSILEENPVLTVNMRLIDVQSGRIISSQKVKDFPSNQIFSLVDSLAYLLINDFPVISDSKSEIKNIAEVTTNSEEAYRAYVEGLTLNYWNYSAEAKAAFERAVELDSNFAMAYFYLSFSQQLAGEAFLSWKSFQKAVKLADNVTECERLQIFAVNYMKLKKYEKAIETLNQVIERYPHEIFPYTSLSVLYKYSLLEPKKMIEICRLGLKNIPSYKWFWNGQAYAFAYLNQRSEAFNAINNYINSAPFKPNPYDSKGDLYIWFMEYDSSCIQYKKAINLRRDFASSTNLGYYHILRNNYTDALKYFHMSGYKIPLVEIHRGQILKAQKKSSDLLNSQISQIEALSVLRKKIHLSYETKQYPEMLRLADRLSKELRKYPPEKIYGRNYIAWALAKLGRYSEAYKLLDSIRTDIAGITPRLQVSAEYLSAIISLEEGNNEIALKQFKKAINILPPNHEPNFFYSVCLLKCGHLPEAVSEFQRLIYWPGTGSNYLFGDVIGSIAYWPIQTVKAHYWLGVAFEQQGKKEEAIKEYKKFLDIWKDADFDSPEITDANKRVLRLSDTIR
jgi:serine/threonine protein kinase/tetratricopeptide (TPR) repeat protein